MTPQPQKTRRDCPYWKRNHGETTGYKHCQNPAITSRPAPSPDVLEQLESWCCKEEADADEQGDYVVQSVFCQVIDKIRSLRTGGEPR